MFSAWLTRAWAVLKAAPLILLALASAVMAISAARRARSKAEQAARIDTTDIAMPDAAEQAQRVQSQIDIARRVNTHVQTATRARRQADAAAAKLESAGQPSMAELVREWNRE